MISDKLLEFIRAAKGKGVSDDSIVSILKQNGWSERRVFDAFSSYYEETLGTPIPARGTRVENARDAFYYLLAFITLGFWTVALVWFADIYVDHVFTSALDYAISGSYFRSEIAGQMATLMIAFPLFLFISWMIAREVARRPEALESGVRKWLTYIALVITAVTLLCDAVWFLTTFLTGDLTVRFAWKAFVLFVVAGGVFSYYLGVVRAASITPLRDRVYLSVAIVVVVAAIVLGFTATGTPSQQRELSMDDKRVNDLTDLSYRIAESWSSSSQQAADRRLPKSLDDLPAYVPKSDKLDPETNTPFEYRPDGGSKYELCATFSAPSESTDSQWAHSAGHHCFLLDATKR